MRSPLCSRWFLLLVVSMVAVPAGPQAGHAELVTPASPFSDVRPTDWAYEALSNLMARHCCGDGYPIGTLASQRTLTRYEAAAQLQACLVRVTTITDELKALQREFAQELAQLQGQVDGAEVRVAELEAVAFSTTTKLSGLATFVVGSNQFSGSNRPLVSQARAAEGSTSFNYDVRLTLDTSFTGKDLLRSQVWAGNFADSAWGNANGVNQLVVAFQENCGTGVDCGDVVAIYRLYYQTPLGNDFTLTVGGRVRQDDMLAMWPSVYPGDGILDVFTYSGAPGAYNTNLGAGAGLWWRKNGWSLSTLYIAANGDASIGTLQAGETGTLQLGYSGGDGGWGVAGAYTYTSGIPGGVYPGSATPLAALNTAAYPALQAFGTNGVTNSLGLSAYWQPSDSGWMPAISVGWGLNRINPGEGVDGLDRLTTQSWSVGVQWTDVLISGNTAGMAFGQPTFLTSCGNTCGRLLGSDQASPRDGLFAWEWWYRIQVSDQLSVTPALYYLSNPYGQINKVLGQQASVNSPSFNNLGLILKASLQF